MSCFGRSLQLVGMAALVGGGAVAWLYRDRIAEEVHRRLPSREVPAVESVRGRPGDDALGRAHDKLDSLLAWRADSVVLSASETASLIGSGLDPAVRGNLDSLEVELREGSLVLRARLRTAALPRGLLGPAQGMLAPWEPIAAAGTIALREPGWAVWRVNELEFGQFPLPRDLLPRLLQSAVGGGDGDGATLPLRLPPGVGGLALHSSGLTLYPAPARP